MRIIVTGSLAYDYIMNFPGKFSDHILPDKVHMLTVSFLVDSMKRLRGGTAGNIAYNLGILGAKAVLVSAAGQDFAEYKDVLARSGVDLKGVKEVPHEFTASCFINTDQVNNQIVAFYPGAVVHAREVTLQSVGLTKGDWVIISPTDPESMLRHTAECKQASVSYIFDPGKQTPRLDKQQILGGIDGCAALVGNDYEFGMMARTTGVPEAELIAMAPLTVMTRGHEGSRFYVKGKVAAEIPVAKVEEVVDPTGAGDAYLAGLAFGLAKGLPYEVCGRLAALTATYAIEKRGCQEHSFERPAFARRYHASFGTELPAGAL
ncbi:MAG: carbohydrate kinase family protein [Myxococcales bacterium]|nr:carbohydrate kinase family protein [Myxococcales bacterium]